MDRFNPLDCKIQAEILDVAKIMDEVVDSMNFNGEIHVSGRCKQKIPKLEDKISERSKVLNKELDNMEVYISRENLIIISLSERGEKDIPKIPKRVLQLFFVAHLKTG